MNGGQAETHVLYEAPADSGGERNAVGNHVLTLETLGVKPGDSILYRFIAEDARVDLPEAGADLDSLRGFSQPYFLAVRPFDEELFKGSASASSFWVHRLPRNGRSSWRRCASPNARAS